MLQLFRSGLTSYFATALLGLLIASFALWGIGGDILGGASNNIAQIGDSKLSRNDYAREFQNKYAEIQQQSEGEITKEMVVDQGYTKRWVADLIQRKTFAYTAHKLNIRITDAELRKFIMSIEVFQDTFGQFSKAKFESIARYQGYSATEFEEILRRDLERQYLMSSIASSISVPNILQDTLVKFLLEERTAEIITVKASTVKNIPTPTEEELIKYYQDSTENYMAPEYRDIRFMTLSSSDFAKDITVTAEEVDQAITDQANTKAENEKRDFQQILFDNKEAADKAFADLEKGRSFKDIILASGALEDEALVRDNTMQDSTDTYGINAAELIFTTQEGQYTHPVETDFGWRIFNITKISATTVDKNTLRVETEEKLKKEKALDLLYNKTELINDELAAGASLSDIAENLNIKMHTALDMDATGYNSKGDLVKEIPTDTVFLTKAFSSMEGDEPALEELSNGDYFLLAVDNIKGSSLRPFEDVKSSVLDLWLARARENTAREKANELLILAQEGKTLADLAAKQTELAFTSVTLARNDQTGQVTRTIQNSIFDLDVNSAKILPAADGNGFVVVKLLSKKISDKALPSEQNEQLKKILVQEYEQRILSNYWIHLENALPVVINERAINAVHDQLVSRE
ncbi:MAG: SurA N-terminal domain-containing protein [Emcibacter sp.]|nr:SurA N-terminal domain-containing protein [Emcibacter sp.]